MFDRTKLHPGQRVLDADGDFIGTVTAVHGDHVRIAQDGVVDSHHDVPMSRFAHADDRGVHMDGPWSTIKTTLGGLAAGAAAAVTGAAATAAHAMTPDHNDRGTAYTTGTHATTHNTTTHTTRTEPVHTPVHTEEKKSILPWLLLGGAALAGILALSQCNKDDAQVDVTNAATPAATASVDGATTTTTVRTETVTLPGGASLQLASDSIGYELNSFLSGNEAVGTGKAFTFDNLNFDTGSAAIRPQDQGTIDTIAQIMTAYPKARGVIIGYTDATGNAAANEKLSAERAKNVAAAITAKGVAAGRLTSKAGGVAATTGAADQNARRTDLVITAR